MQRFFEEVMRRKVLPVALAYAIGGWVLLQVGDVLIGLLELPGWTGKILVALVAFGLPIAVILSWVYDWTPKGIVVTGDEFASAAGSFIFSDPEPVEVGELQLVSPELGELIGRHDECETLRECLQAAKGGAGGIALIGGEPGVGKSRLGEEALAIDRNMGLLPLTSEVRNVVLVARLVTLAALQRKESRGAHYRDDYPNANNEWKRRQRMTISSIDNSRRPL